eukprot:COSAG02_NODE_14031_length_1319_cov_5.955738_2_plen_91_part_00
MSAEIVAMRLLTQGKRPFALSHARHTMGLMLVELRQGDSFSQSFWPACNTTHSHSHFGLPATPLILTVILDTVSFVLRTDLNSHTVLAYK